MRWSFIDNIYKDAIGNTFGETGITSGALYYEGTWDADNNIPILQSGVGERGHYYVINVAGNTNIDGITDWKVSDWIIFNGTVWEKIDNSEILTAYAYCYDAVDQIPVSVYPIYTNINISSGLQLYNCDKPNIQQIRVLKPGKYFCIYSLTANIFGGFLIRNLNARLKKNNSISYEDSRDSQGGLCLGGSKINVSGMVILDLIVNDYLTLEVAVNATGNIYIDQTKLVLFRIGD